MCKLVCERVLLFKFLTQGQAIAVHERVFNKMPGELGEAGNISSWG